MTDHLKVSDLFLRTLHLRGISCDGQWKILHQSILKLEEWAAVQERQKERAIADLTAYRLVVEGTT